MSDYQTIRYQRQGDIGTLTLARPGKRNAQNPLMWEALAGDRRDVARRPRLKREMQVHP